MNDDEMKKFVAEWSPMLVQSDGTINQMMVFRLCQEVERATRHRIVDSLGAVSHAIDTRVDLRAVLRDAKVCS